MDSGTLDENRIPVFRDRSKNELLTTRAKAVSPGTFRAVLRDGSASRLAALSGNSVPTRTQSWL